MLGEKEGKRGKEKPIPHWGGECTWSRGSKTQTYLEERVGGGWMGTGWCAVSLPEIRDSSISAEGGKHLFKRRPSFLKGESKKGAGGKFLTGGG